MGTDNFNRSHWTSYGLVRGQCGHRHREVDSAIRCISHDRVACKREGGDSDRSVWLIDDNGYLKGSTGEHAFDRNGARVRFETEGAT